MNLKNITLEDLVKNLQNEDSNKPVDAMDLTVCKMYASATGNLPESIASKVLGKEIEENGKTVVYKSIEDLIRDYHPNSDLVGRKAHEKINAIYHNVEFLNMLSKKSSPNRVYTSDIKNFAKRILGSAERLGSQIDSKDLGFTVGKDVYLQACDAKWDIPLGLVRDKMDEPSWLREQEQDFLNTIANDIAMLRVEGEGGYGQGNDDFKALLYGHNYMLKNMHGQNTFSADTKLIFGETGKYVTPKKVNIADTSDYDLLEIMDKLISNIPKRYRKDTDLSFVMSPELVDKYRDLRGTDAKEMTDSVGVNTTYRDNLVTTGQVPTYKGYRVLSDIHESSVKDGGIIFFGGLNELEVINQEIFRYDNQYNPRNSKGAAFELTANFYLAFNIRIPDRCCVAFEDAKVETPYLVKTDSLKPEKFSSYTISQAGNLSVYPWSDTEDSKIFYSATEAHLDDYASAVADATAIPHGEELELTSTSTVYFRAFKDDDLLASDKITLAYTKE